MDISKDATLHLLETLGIWFVLKWACRLFHPETSCSLLNQGLGLPERFSIFPYPDLGLETRNQPHPPGLSVADVAAPQPLPRLPPKWPLATKSLILSFRFKWKGELQQDELGCRIYRIRKFGIEKSFPEEPHWVSNS